MAEQNDLVPPDEPSDAARAEHRRTLIGITRSALVAQSARIDAIDLKAFALLGFDGALLAAAIAAGKTDLGAHWWTTVFGVFLSMLLCAVASRGKKTGIEMGPAPMEFYERYWDAAPGEFEIALMRDLEWALDANDGVEVGKRGWLAAAGGVLLVNVLYSAPVFVWWR